MRSVTITHQGQSQEGLFHDWKVSDNQLCAIVEVPGGSVKFVPYSWIKFTDNKQKGSYNE